MKMKTSLLAFLSTTVFSLTLIGLTSNGLGQVDAEKAKTNSKIEEAPDEIEEIHGFKKETSDRLLSSLRKGAFSNNDSVSYLSLEMFSQHPEFHQSLGEGVQLELVKRAISKEFTAHFGLNILRQSEIQGLERQDLLLKMFKQSGGQNSNLDRDYVLAELKHVSETLVDRFAQEIEKNPLGEHTDKIDLIERLGRSAEKAVPALLKRYHALKELAAKEGRPPNYLNELIAIGEIGSSSGMEIILDACEEHGGEERERYFLVGIECVSRMLKSNSVSSSPYTKYAKSLMKNYDKDSSGFLSEAENSAMRRPIDMKYDRNRDRKLSEDEIVKSFGNKSRSSRSQTLNSKSIRESIGLDR